MSNYFQGFYQRENGENSIPKNVIWELMHLQYFEEKNRVYVQKHLKSVLYKNVLIL
jgi:hypothetical protein